MVLVGRRQREESVSSPTEGRGGEIKPLAHRTVDIGEMPLLLPPPPICPSFSNFLLPIFGFPRGDSVEKKEEDSENQKGG